MLFLLRINFPEGKPTVKRPKDATLATSWRVNSQTLSLIEKTAVAPFHLTVNSFNFHRHKHIYIKHE